ncbi:MAG: metallophosphoesterase family protein [Haliscomenobacter sp.]|uniref:metallophosphoesterase family protein n=1 Tax=Haliscomenobacter sp. TaxID=2717303 RepID=UPI0029B5B1A5|nr:metallophosphoesterase family protein [Haliscomenobacter sp.]MDX2068967.1 metallophosphoesterase family protein [Haliscomenobacter sp.]
MRKIAISDIHGCNATFEALLQQINFSKADQLFLLGDYLDRGPSSKQVLDTIFRLKAEGYHLQCLRGNHEEMLLWALNGHGYNLESFLRNGGDTTLASFAVKKPRDIPRQYLDFLENLPFWIESDEYIFVHAGLHFVQGSNPFEHQDQMLWIRNWAIDLDLEWLGERYVVHGHTPTPNTTIQQLFRHFNGLRVINIDAGCVYQRTGYGHLCAVDLSNRILYFEPRHTSDDAV